MLLRVFDVINKDTYDGLMEIRKFRNELLHKPKMLMDPDYKESILSKIVSKADNLKFKIINISNEQEKRAEQKKSGIKFYSLKYSILVYTSSYTYYIHLNAGRLF